MNKKMLLISGLALTLITLIPFEVIAQTTNDFGAKDLVEQSNKLQGFLFGPIMRIVGVFGAIGSIVHGVAKHSFTPILTYGAICLSIVIVPLFIDGVFSVSGTLLP